MNEDLKKAELKAQEKINSKLLESEKKYLSEKERLNREATEAESAVRRREYIEKLATASNSLAAEKAHRNERLRLLKEENEAYLSELKAQAQKEREVYEQLKEDVTELYKDILSVADSSIAETEEKRLKMQEKLADYGRLTKKVTFKGAAADGGDEVYTELISLAQTTEVLKDYADNLTEIRNRMTSGAVDTEYANSLIAAVSELSIDNGLEFVKTLNGKSDDEFFDYIKSWTEKEKATKALSAKVYAGEMEKSVEETVSYMKSRLEEMGLDVPEGFFLSGSISAEKFGEGFTSELEEQLLKVRNIIDSFNLSLNAAVSGEKNVSQSTSVYSPTYQINGTGDASAALSSIKAVETRKLLSGIV